MDIFGVSHGLKGFELPLLRFQGQNSKKRPFCGRRIERFFLKISYDLSGVCLLVSSKPSNRRPFSFHNLIRQPAGAFLGCSGLFFCLRQRRHLWFVSEPYRLPPCKESSWGCRVPASDRGVRCAGHCRNHRGGWECKMGGVCDFQQPQKSVIL